MSVVIARDDRDPHEMVAGYPGFALVSIPIELLTELEQEIVPDPLPDEPDHVLVIGNKTGGRLKRMSRESVWEIQPPSFP